MTLGPQLRALYVSYDGALDPLGASQVVPYILGLASNRLRMSLISFEKPERWARIAEREELKALLAGAGVHWWPQRYHRKPRLPATLWDVHAGSRAIRRATRNGSPDILHCRGEVAMTMARWSKPPRGTRVLHDMRGFFADERVESGSWRAGSLLDRAVRRAEMKNLARADGLVVLTEAARAILTAHASRLPPHRVIPTCADLDAFRPAERSRPLEYGLVYSGSLGTWYMAEEMVAFARVASRLIPGRVLFLTPDVREAARVGVTPDWADVRAVPPADVPKWLRLARALFFFIRPTPSKRASCPTKLAEALASGLPVVSNRGVGDLDGLLEEQGVGVLVDAFNEDAYERASRRLRELVDDPLTANRCRQQAEQRFSLKYGITAYDELYRILSASAGIQ